MAFLVWAIFFLAGRYFAFYQRPLNQQVIIGAACLFICSLLYTFLLDQYWRLVIRFSRRRPISADVEESKSPAADSVPRRTFHRKGLIAFGIISIISGIGLLYSSAAVAVFTGAFLCSVGAQILLWRMGISLEIISNVPSVIDPQRTHVNDGG
jgi:predicted phage tail protein